MQLHKDKTVNLLGIVFILLFVLSFSMMFISIVGVMPDVTRKVSHYAMRAAELELILLIFALFRYKKRRSQ